jgi:hypothetical protein
MPKYLIERRLPGAGKLSPEELRGIAQKSNGVLRDLTRDGKEVQWLHSYVTDDTIHCVYVASDPEAVLEHARCGGFPADTIMRVRTVIDPTTAE